MYTRLLLGTLLALSAVTTSFGHELLGYATSKREYTDAIDALVAESQRRGADAPCELLICNRQFTQTLEVTFPVWPESAKEQQDLAEAVLEEIVPEMKTALDCLQDEVLYFVKDKPSKTDVLKCTAELVYAGKRITTISYSKPDCVLGKKDAGEQVISYHTDSGKPVELSDLIDPSKEVLLLNAIGGLCEQKKIRFFELLGDKVVEDLQFHLDEEGLVIRITDPDTGKTDSVCLPDDKLIPLMIPKTPLR
jgi:hypothetical protein